MAPGSGRRGGLIFGLNLGPRGRKLLFPQFLDAEPSSQRRVAYSAARLLRNEALILSASRRLSLSVILRSAAFLA